MTNPDLQMLLPAFSIIAMLVILFWKNIRKAVAVEDPSPSIEKIVHYQRLKRISGYYWLIFIGFILMSIVYSTFPELYYLFLPMDQFDHPLINELGLLILQISLVWIVIAQLQIDKELYKYSRDIESLSAMELVRYSEKTLLSGMLVFFIGFFTTITNIIGLVLVILGFYIYFKIFRFGYAA